MNRKLIALLSLSLFTAQLSAQSNETERAFCKAMPGQCSGYGYQMAPTPEKPQVAPSGRGWELLTGQRKTDVFAFLAQALSNSTFKNCKNENGKISDGKLYINSTSFSSFNQITELNTQGDRDVLHLDTGAGDYRTETYIYTTQDRKSIASFSIVNSRTNRSSSWGGTLDKPELQNSASTSVVKAMECSNL